MGFRTTTGLLLTLLLVACQYGVSLTVSWSKTGTIGLGVASLSSNFRACIDSASIYPADRHDNPVWELGRSDPHDCLQDVTVGTAKAGFAQRSSTPIQPGRKYCAEVNGPGFSERRGFIIDRDGVVESGEDVAAC